MSDHVTTPGPIRILVVDDDAANRRTLVELLEGWDLQVLGEAGDGATAVEMAIELVPDVVLMDVRMPIMDGIEATRIISDALPTSRVILLTAEDDPSLRRRAEERGGFAFLPKGSPARSIHDAIVRARLSRLEQT